MTETPETGQGWVRLASTRPVQYRGDEFVTQFTRSALEDMVAQVTATGVWTRAEHLDFLPPLGITRQAEVREDVDGEAELYIRPAFDLLHYTVDEYAYNNFIKNLIPSLPVSGSPDFPVNISYDRRNFTIEESDSIQKESNGLAVPLNRYSEIPPLAFALVIPVVWGAAKFAGAFLEQLGKEAGSALASKISSWASRSKAPERKLVFSLEFVLSDNARLHGFIFANPQEVEKCIKDVLISTENLATIAGIQKEKNIFTDMKQTTFFLVEGEWKLGWWTDGNRVIKTKWFTENPPDVEGVLGHPPFWEMGGLPPNKEDEAV